MLFPMIFHVEEIFYPDIKMYSCEETTDVRYPNFKIGVLYLALGLFYQSCYIPCIIAMSRPPLINNACFKIMVYLGVIDVLCLTICADFAGLWSMSGQLYCSSPQLSFVLGCLAMGFWSATCMCCIILAFNRTCDLVFSSGSLFDGGRIKIWLAFPTLYFIYFSFFDRPLFFDPRNSTFFFDPHTNYSASMDPNRALRIYANVPHSINNAVVIITLVSMYFIICCNLMYKAHKSQLAKVSSMTKQIILQSSIICGCHVVGCFLYVYTQYFPVPPIFTIITNLAWMGNHGLPGVIYLTLNQTIRDQVLSMLGARQNIYKVPNSNRSDRQATITETQI